MKFERATPLLLVMVLASVARGAPPSVTKVGDSVLDARGMTLTEGAAFGRSINGQAFQCEGITTFGRWQYAVYFVAEAGEPDLAKRFHLAVARRKGNEGKWEVADLKDSVFRNGTGKRPKPWDAHNTASIGICPGDGSIHLAYDHHDSLLRYRRTGAGVAAEPEKQAWNASLFQPETAELLPGEAVKSVTYPAFVVTPKGDLQLGLRRGYSGNGSWWLYDYSAEKHAWVAGRQYDDGTTVAYAGVTPASPTRCSYLNEWTYGPDGKLHIVWVWREGKANGSNHDICYAYSEDGGVSWKNNVGAVISDTRSRGAGVPKFITLASPGILVQELPVTSSLMNTQGQAVDGKGRIHALMWHRDPAKADAAEDPVWDPAESSYFHYWRDESGKWSRSTLPSESGAPVGSRPRLVFDKRDNAYAIYTLRSGGSAGTNGLYFNEADLVIATASAGARWADWKVVHVERGPFVNEPLVDRQAFSATGVLSVMMQASPKTDLEATPIRVLNFVTGASK